MSDIQVSQQGYDRLVQELTELRNVRRPQIRDAIQRAREFGDLKENSEYHSAKDEQGRVESRIQELESVLGRVQVVDLPRDVRRVALHTRVRLQNVQTGEKVEYSIVSGHEASMAERRLSDMAPVSRALMDHEPGDTVTVTIPKGTVNYKILEVLPLEG